MKQIYNVCIGKIKSNGGENMAETKHTTIRFPELVQKKLQELAELDGISRTAVLVNLINKEYKERKDEIKEFKKNSNDK